MNEDQVKTANDMEAARWGDDFPIDQLDVPYTREEPTLESKKGEQTQTTDDDNEEEDEEDESLDLAPVEQVDKSEDPGSYVPKDYSFKVTIAGGKEVTISSPKEAESIADNPDNFETPKQLMDFLNKSNKLERNLEHDQDDWQRRRDAYDAKVQSVTERQTVVNNLSNEIEYLGNKGLLPKIPAEYKDADWSDAEVRKQTGVKEAIGLINYMTKENTRREKAGISPISSALDALNAFNQDKERKEAVKHSKEAGESRKVAGARIAGVSAGSEGGYTAPKGIAVGNPNVLKRGRVDWE